jgi:hypothetical protein
MPLYVDITCSMMLYSMICLKWIMSGVTRAEFQPGICIDLRAKSFGWSGRHGGIFGVLVRLGDEAVDLDRCIPMLRFDLR